MDVKNTQELNRDEGVSESITVDLQGHAQRTGAATDSMVTIRLSDVAPLSPVGEISNEQSFDGPSADDFSGIRSDGDLTQDHEDGLFSRLDMPMAAHELEQAHMVREEASTSSSIVTPKNRPTLAINTPRPRSDSSKTHSSVGSGHVDWDQLDRSEEQAPRDECSDEVFS